MGFLLQCLLILGGVYLFCEIASPLISGIYKPPVKPAVKRQSLPEQVYFFGNMPLREDKHAKPSKHPIAQSGNAATDERVAEKDSGGLNYFS